jgi:hypothetical protein
MAASSNKHPELHYYSTQSNDFGVKPYIFMVKKFIEMVDYGVQVLLDNKIQDGRRLKGKQQNFFIIHNVAIIVVSNAMLSGSRNSLKCLIRV